MSTRTERQQSVLKQIEVCPGANLRQLHRLTGIPLSTTARILDSLEEEGAIRSELDKAYRRFFPAGKGLHKRERVLLGFLTKPRPRSIMETLLDQPGIRHTELAEAVELPAPTLTYYLKQIVGHDLVLVRKRGAARHYRVKNPEMLRKALDRTEPGFDPQLA